MVRFTDHDPRHWIGVAKKESSHYLKVEGLAPVGGLWATRCKCLPVRDREHCGNATDYVLDHVTRGAAVWQPSAVDPMADFDPVCLLLDRAGPEHLNCATDQELEARLLQRLDDHDPGIETTPEFWRDLNARAIAPADRRKDPRGRG
jgi:hypothetical protein